MYNYLLEEEEEEIVTGQQSWLNSLASRIPFLGILLVVGGVSVFQGSSVLAKKMSLHPLMTILYGDILKFTYAAPFTVYGGETPFPKGRVLLVVARGLFAGLQLMGHFYAVKYLPISDITMISSIKPVFSTLLACIFLKESCGILEIVNLVLVVTGIGLVVQPSFIFGETDSQYDSQMMYAAVGLGIAQGLGSSVSVIIRSLRDMHWAALAISTRIFSVFELTVVCGIMGLYCFPNCDFDRWGIIGVAIFGNITQFLFILALKFEEAHIVGVTDNASGIIVSFLFQLVFFQDSPNLLKIIGACVVIFSILLVGGKKIHQHRAQKKQEEKLPSKD